MPSLFEFVKDTVRRCWDGSIPPHIMFWQKRSTGGRVLKTVDCSGIFDDKDLIEELMIELVKKGVTEFCFVTESWAASAGKNDEAAKARIEAYVATGRSLADYPGRSEWLIVIHESRAGTRGVKTDINRSTDPPTLGEWEEADSPSDAGGRFANIFRKAREGWRGDKPT